MDLSTFSTMDPHLLVGLVNTELRNHCESLDDLVATHGLDRDSLVERLGTFLGSPLQTLLVYGSGLAGGVVPLAEFRPLTAELPVLQQAVYLLTLAVYVLALVLYLRDGMWQRNLLQLLLALVPLMFISAVAIARYDFNNRFGLEYPAVAVRYAFNACLGWVGVLWIYQTLRTALLGVRRACE